MVAAAYADGGIATVDGPAELDGGPVVLVLLGVDGGLDLAPRRGTVGSDQTALVAGPVARR